MADKYSDGPEAHATNAGSDVHDMDLAISKSQRLFCIHRLSSTVSIFFTDAFTYQVMDQPLQGLSC
jgi:hypothetical protein